MCVVEWTAASTLLKCLLIKYGVHFSIMENAMTHLKGQLIVAFTARDSNIKLIFTLIRSVMTTRSLFILIINYSYVMMRWWLVSICVNS